MGSLSATNVKDGLGDHNFGSIITVEDRKDILITWSDVLNSMQDGLQIWTQLEQIRDSTKLFVNAQRDEAKALRIINLLYEESYGDNVQSLFCC